MAVQGWKAMLHLTSRVRQKRTKMYGYAQRVTTSLAGLLNKRPLFVASKMYQNVRNDEKRR